MKNHWVVTISDDGNVKKKRKFKGPAEVVAGQEYHKQIKKMVNITKHRISKKYGL